MVTPVNRTPYGEDGAKSANDVKHLRFPGEDSVSGHGLQNTFKMVGCLRKS